MYGIEPTHREQLRDKQAFRFLVEEYLLGVRDALVLFFKIVDIGASFLYKSYTFSKATYKKSKKNYFSLFLAFLAIMSMFL